MFRKLCLATLLSSSIAAFPFHGARAATVVDTQTVLNRVFGVDLHLGASGIANYTNLTTVEAQIKYIGATRLRDWASLDDSLPLWQNVHAATGLSFHASIPETSPAHQELAIPRIVSWIKTTPGLIDTIEGGNEEDDPYAISQGASLAQAALMQTEVYTAGHKAGVQVDQLSVGSGWLPPLYLGNYEYFGKPPADHGNAHVYMNPNSPPLISLTRLGTLAAYSVPGKSVDITEFGCYASPTQTDATTSAFMHEAPFDAFGLGDAGLFVYALHDDTTGVVSFYDALGNKRAFADYWHFTTQLLADPKGVSLPAKTVNLTYTHKITSGVAPLGIQNLPMYKSDGSLWIAVYDEERSGAADGAETIGLGKTYSLVKLVDARSGILLAQEANASVITVPLPPNHVYFVVAQ